jgi:peptidoglycan/LPS O-acetylase OafA/YrhL
MEVLIALSAVVAATLAASLSWHFFEKPLIARGHRYRYDSLPSEPDIATARELPAAPA